MNAAAPTNPSERLEKGAVIADRYLVLDYVAAGGMGAIYRARHLNHDRIVAVKIMRSELANDERAVARFKREIEVVCKLTNEHTITVYDFGFSSGLLYIAMEWLEGRDLAQLIHERGALDPKTATDYALQICKSLAEAHAKDIIHRDLKLENLFLIRLSAREQRLKVLDFGLAKMIGDDAQTQITRIGTVCGTPEYMSPEHARGEELDGRSDIYALGCVLYAMLMGEPPFSHENPMKVVLFHQEKTLPKLPPHLPPTLNRIIQKATRKKVDKRYATIQDLRDDLKAFYEGADEATEKALETAPTFVELPQLESSNSPSLPVARSARRIFPMLALAGVMVLIGVIAVMLLSAEEPKPTPQDAETASESESPSTPPPDATVPEVVVEVYPGDAMILVDGKGQAQPAPLRLTNTEGLSHTLEVIPVDPTYAGQTLPLNVKAGVRKTITLTLQPR